MTLLALTVGAITAGAAAFDGAGACSSVVAEGGPADPECYHLVRVLAEKLGVLVAAATAIFTLTAIGLNRLLMAPDREATDPAGT